ncbi:Bifunctional polymyxin resistance protein ArnA [compost metagenome]
MASVSLLLSDPQHPIKPRIEAWIAHNQRTHQIELCHQSSELSGGDFLFLVSCQELIRAAQRSRYRYTLVLHASDLPEGRGMSPHVWQVLAGRNEFMLSLLNAEDEVDAGDIWRKRLVRIRATDLWHEIDARLFDAELELISWALEHCDTSIPLAQKGPITHYRRRTPEDSRIDLSKPLLESFNQLRVANPNRYPAWFEIDGQRFVLKLEKLST